MKAKKTYRKRGPPRKTGPGLTIGIRCQEAFLDRIDRWRENQSDELTRPASIRRLAEIGLASAHQAPPDKKFSASASEMAARTIDRLSDKAVPTEEQEKRKRRLLKGPQEFREMRSDHLKATR